MTEKIISEFKIVETDDGFRIEIKGNKEAIRRMLREFDLYEFFTEFPHVRRSFCCGPGFFNGFHGWWWGWGMEKEDKTGD